MFADYKSKKNKNYDNIQLGYSCLMFLSGNYSWFCRVWRKDLINSIGTGRKTFGQSYGKNKFQAYRLAIKDLNSY